MSDRANRKHQVRPAEARVFVLSSIALSTGVFGIAFWYGVFGTVFFEHLFTLWVASTVALIASLFIPRLTDLPSYLSWRGRFVLLLPTVWLLYEAFINQDAAGMWDAGWLSWGLTIAMVALTLPYLLYVVILVAVPDIEKLKQPRLQSAIVLITAAMALVGYAIGANHERFITCYDFKVSGSNVPEDCRAVERAQEVAAH